MCVYVYLRSTPLKAVVEILIGLKMYCYFFIVVNNLTCK